ncbi:protein DETOXIFICATION 16-like isoform X2 [Humulus lupulus]|uniref:protein DETOXIFICATION 16-like isoform X2 n=1 Tax=Humulus lupulus TaxID=3486 RepID=UPI002B407BF7|nr:protein DETOXIFICATION 16-like isoform X2 [Humulus lupulus]
MDMEEHNRLLPKPVPLITEVNATHLRKDQNKDDIVAEVKQQLQLAGPLICVNLLTYCLQVISVMFVGHLGELALAGASMATSFASVTGFSLLIGMASALETFCGQSYGAKQYHMLGIHMQRGMIVLLVVSIPLAIIWFNAGQILLFLGQDPEISAEAGRYARFMIPSIFAYAVTQCHTKFLQTQNNVVPMMITAGITTLLHFFICWFLVFKSGLGNRGAAMANAISYWINALSLVLYVRISPTCKSTWTGFSMEAFRGIPKFLKLSIPSAAMLTLEIWSFEMMVLVSGFLPNPKLETSVLSISTRVSNELGAGRPQIARLALCVALSMVVTEGTFVAAVMILGHGIWGYCYSTEEKVVKYVGQMLILIAISHFFDGIQSVLSGSVRGSGRQKIGAFANLAAYYLVGIPVAIVLAFVFHLGGKGLWMGIIVALIVQALCLAILTICTDWEKEVNNASNRVHSTKAAISDELS